MYAPTKSLSARISQRLLLSIAVAGVMAMDIQMPTATHAATITQENNEGALPYREIVIGRVTKVTSPGSPTGPPWQQPDRGDEHSNVKSGPIDTRHQHGPCKDSVPGARDNIDQGGSARKAVSPGQLRGTDCRAACTHADGAGRLCGSSPIRTDGKRAAIDESRCGSSIRSARAKPARPNAAASV